MANEICAKTVKNNVAALVGFTRDRCENDVIKKNPSSGVTAAHHNEDADELVITSTPNHGASKEPELK